MHVMALIQSNHGFLSLAAKLAVIVILIVFNVQISSLLSCILGELNQHSRSNSSEPSPLAPACTVYNLSSVVRFNHCYSSSSILYAADSPLLHLPTAQNIKELSDFLTACMPPAGACKMHRTRKHDPLENACPEYVQLRSFDKCFLCIYDKLRPYLMLTTYTLSPLETLALQRLLPLVINHVQTENL